VAALRSTPSKDKTARIWDAATAKDIAVLRGHENIVTSAAFSPDGKRIVTASVDRTARIWDPATTKEIYRNAASLPEPRRLCIGLSLREGQQPAAYGLLTFIADSWNATTPPGRTARIARRTMSTGSV
jgi:WD40 repeat protein